MILPSSAVDLLHMHMLCIMRASAAKKKKSEWTGKEEDLIRFTRPPTAERPAVAVAATDAPVAYPPAPLLNCLSTCHRH